MSAPLVSIVIPCYNGAEFVADAIQSALDQTWANKEVIVIDDGSTDKSPEIVRGFGNQVRFVSDSHRGGAAARNLGIELARGKFIQFLDADDLLKPRAISTKFLQIDNREDVSTCCAWISIAESGKSAQHTPPSFKDAVLLNLGHQLTIEGPLHLKSTLENIGSFDETLPCCQERDLHLRLACHGVDFLHIPDVLHKVRRQQGSVSSHYTRVLLHHEKIFLRAYKEVVTRGQLTAERAAAFSKALATGGRQLIHRKESPAGTRMLAAAKAISIDGLRNAYGSSLSWQFAKLLGPGRAEQLRAILRERGQVPEPGNP